MLCFTTVLQLEGALMSSQSLALSAAPEGSAVPRCRRCTRGGEAAQRRSEAPRSRRFEGLTPFRKNRVIMNGFYSPGMGWLS